MSLPIWSSVPLPLVFGRSPPPEIAALDEGPLICILAVAASLATELSLVLHVTHNVVAQFAPAYVSKSRVVGPGVAKLSTCGLIVQGNTFGVVSQGRSCKHCHLDSSEGVNFSQDLRRC